MTSRDLGRWTKVRVVTNKRQFDRWWPEFQQTMGTFPLVGFNCKFNGNQVLKQMKQQGMNPDQMNNTQKDDGETSQSDDERSCEGDFEDEKEYLLGIRDRNSAKGKVALIELASFGGYVLLIRSCFFSDLPSQIKSLLIGSEIQKIGQGLEKDINKLRESFGVQTSAAVDIRNVCLLWPWFTSHYDFDQFGVHSVANFLFDGSFPNSDCLSPFYITKYLDKDQIHAAATEVQLSVDLYVFVILRYLGWRLPPDWCSNINFGQMLQLWSSNLLDKSFLDNKLRPSMLKNVAFTAAKRAWDKNVLKKLREDCGKGCTLRLATLWAWSLPRTSELLEKMLIRSPGDGLPCFGRPFVSVDAGALLTETDFQVILNSGDELWKMVDKNIILSGQSSDGKKYKIKVHIETLDEISFDGGDGTGLPKDSATVLGVLHRSEEDPFTPENYQRVLAAAMNKVPMIRLRQEWKSLEQQIQEKECETDEFQSGDASSTPLAEVSNCDSPQVQETVTEDGLLLSCRRVLGTSPEVGMGYVPPIWQETTAPINESAPPDDPKQGNYYYHGSAGRFYKSEGRDERYEQRPTRSRGPVRGSRNGGGRNYRRNGGRNDAFVDLFDPPPTRGFGRRNGSRNDAFVDLFDPPPTRGFGRGYSSPRSSNGYSSYGDDYQSRQFKGGPSKRRGNTF